MIAVWIAIFSMTGILAGLAAGLFGVGGGVVIVPVLLFAFTAHGIDPIAVTHLALGTSLAAIFPGMLSAAISHHRHRQLLAELFVKLSIGLVPGVIVGGFVAAFLPGVLLRIAVAALLTLVAIKMILNWQPKPVGRLTKTWMLAGAGSTIGGISAITGVGGGGLMVPFLIWRTVPIHKAIATSAACGSLIALFGASSYIAAGLHHPLLPTYATGFVYWPAVLCITLFSIFSAPIGARLAQISSAQLLRLGFAGLMLIASWAAVFSDHLLS